MKLALEKVRPVALTLQTRLTDILMQNTKRVFVNQVSVYPFEWCKVKEKVCNPDLPKVQRVQNGCRTKCEIAALHRINGSAQKATDSSAIALDKFNQNRQIRLIRAENRCAARDSYNAITRRQCRANGGCLAPYLRRLRFMARKLRLTGSNQAGGPKETSVDESFCPVLSTIVQHCLKRCQIDGAKRRTIARLGSEAAEVCRAKNPKSPFERKNAADLVAAILDNIVGAIVERSKRVDAAKFRQSVAGIIDDSNERMPLSQLALARRETSMWEEETIRYWRCQLVSDVWALRTQALDQVEGVALLDEEEEVIVLDDQEQVAGGEVQIRVDAPVHRLIRGRTTLAATIRDVAYNLGRDDQRAGALNDFFNLQHFPILEREKNTDESGENMCAICCSDMNGLSDLKMQALLMTQCNHVGHYKCMLRALEQNGNCPYCRALVKTCSIKFGSAQQFIELDLPLAVYIRPGRRQGRSVRVLPNLNISFVWTGENLTMQ